MYKNTKKDRGPKCGTCGSYKSTEPSHLKRVPTGKREPAGSAAAKHTIVCQGDKDGPHGR
jgi:hypothetical protein